MVVCRNARTHWSIIPHSHLSCPSVCQEATNGSKRSQHCLRVPHTPPKLPRHSSAPIARNMTRPESSGGVWSRDASSGHEVPTADLVQSFTWHRLPPPCATQCMVLPHAHLMHPGSKHPLNFSDVSCCALTVLKSALVALVVYEALASSVGIVLNHWWLLGTHLGKRGGSEE